jgi:calcium/calmodulin-dependent protein kinase I
MIKEFRSLAKLEHPNIVKVNKLFIDFKDGFQNHSTIYVVMEIVEGMEMF